MEDISILAIDLAKGSFQVCGMNSGGTILFNRAVSRLKLRQLLAEQKACIVAMEACATAHHWGRVAQSDGHEVRLIPTQYVKPFVKRQKNDRADAEAMDDVVVVDDVDAVTIAASAGPGVADDQGAAEKRLDAIIVEVDPQTLPDQLRWRTVEDAPDQEASGPGEARRAVSDSRPPR